MSKKKQILKQTGTPEKGDGRRLPETREVMGLMNDPAFREFVMIQDKEYMADPEVGRPTGVTMLALKQMKKHRATDMQAAAQKRAIDLQLQKQKGILDK